MSSGKLHFAKIWESNAKLFDDSPALINDSQSCLLVNIVTGIKDC